VNGLVEKNGIIDAAVQKGKQIHMGHKKKKKGFTGPIHKISASHVH
jgi:hypothetical protein